LFIARDPIERSRYNDHTRGVKVPPLIRAPYVSWTVVVPVLAVVVLAIAWGRNLPGVMVGVVTALLAGAVLAAVHHAEVVAHRVGEPYGSLVLAVAVTVIDRHAHGRRWRRGGDPGPRHRVRRRDHHV
jgi:Ca2+:H+ antiporter